jgi:hypothetical protein
VFLITEQKYVEIKGWMRDDAKLKWDQFLEIHPDSELWTLDVLRSMGLKQGRNGKLFFDAEAIK